MTKVILVGFPEDPKLPENIQIVGRESLGEIDSLTAAQVVLQKLFGMLKVDERLLFPATIPTAFGFKLQGYCGTAEVSYYEDPPVGFLAASGEVEWIWPEPDGFFA